MEIDRASAPAMHIPSHGHHHNQALDIRSNIASRSSSHTSLTSSHSRDPMAIPGIRAEEPPPPLPPPRYNEELDRGVDTAWTWQNRELYGGGGHSSLAPVKPSSSLYGGYMQPRGRTQLCSEPDEMNLDHWDRRSSAVLAFRAPSQINLQVGTGNGNGSVPGLVRRPPSPTLSSQRLHGERPLAQQNFDRSSQAYDQQLLSKIGKPNSPPRHSRSDSADSTHLARKLSLQTRDSTQSQRVTVADLPAIASDPMSRWVASPGSGALSPCARPNWRDYMDHRSPSNDSTPPSLLLDPELFVQARASGKPSRTGSKLGNDGYSSPTGVSQRGSYDTTMSTDADQDFPPEEGTASRKFHLNAQRHHSERKPSRQGMKRRAPSPPAEVARDDKPRAYPADPGQTITGATLSRSPATQNQSLPGYGSVSSTASSLRLHSYPSSFAPSLTGSSLTSISSLERQSPPDPAQLPFITSTHLVASPVNSAIPSRRTPTQQSPPDTMAASRKMSIQSAVNDTPPPAAPRTGAHFMCDCCPKKPRKFGTEEELRAHQMEKQYSCQYCNNRFKNKNEAERHQNSLHLRRHSWSCAAIPSYHAAFHPTSSISGPTPTTPLSDACGFCGEEFPNHPQPDWERRIAHLTNVHKFGECNQTKKFYRADHFRQHLKHSHAGQSGKWTNILESVCLREEQPAEVVGMSPAERDGGPPRGHQTDAVRRGGGAAVEGHNDP